MINSGSIPAGSSGLIGLLVFIMLQYTVGTSNIFEARSGMFWTIYRVLRTAAAGGVTLTGSSADRYLIIFREVTPTGYTPAHESTATVAPFRAWRGLPSIVAKEPVEATKTCAQIRVADYRQYNLYMQQNSWRRSLKTRALIL